MNLEHQKIIERAAQLGISESAAYHRIRRHGTIESKGLSRHSPNRLIFHNGESHTLKEWAAIYGISFGAMKYRFYVYRRLELLPKRAAEAKVKGTRKVDARKAKRTQETPSTKTEEVKTSTKKCKSTTLKKKPIKKSNTFLAFEKELRAIAAEAEKEEREIKEMFGTLKQQLQSY